MRLSRLDLTRYGRFTDRTIEFGPRVPGRPDLHVVYGPNEAGKSTTVSAMLDLLFGIEMQSDYDFLHGYKAMQVGARIDTEAGSREAVRIKRKVGSLVDPAGAPIDPAFLTSALAGLDRAQYRMMFSLDDATLEEGGEAILASRGDLGQLLFSATAGLTELHDTIASIGIEANGFHKVRGRAGELAKLKGELAALKVRRDEIDTVASEHARLVSARSEALRVLEAARQARAETKGLVASHRAVLGALPHVAVLASGRAELGGLLSLPDAPSSWGEELPDLVREEVEVAARLEEVDAQISDLEGKVGAIVVDEEALAASGEVRRLAHLRSRHSDAVDALPGAKAGLDAASDEVAEVLRELGGPAETDPRLLLPPMPVLAVLHDLAGTRSGVVEALRRAGDDVADLEAAVAAAEEGLGGRSAVEGSGEAASVQQVRSALAAARDGAHGALASIAVKALERREAQLAQALLALRPWEGDVGRLAAMVTPARSDVEAWRVGLAEATATAAEAAGDVEAHGEEMARLRAEADAMREAMAGAADDPGVVRGVREKAWASHRATLDPASADAFERAMRLDDVVTSSRIADEAEASRVRHLRERIGAATAAADRASATRDRAVADAQAIRSRMAHATADSGYAWDADASPAWLDGWLARRSTALDVGVAFAEAEAELSDAARAADAAWVSLAGVLEAEAVQHDPVGRVERLAVAAQSFLDEEASLVDRRRRLAEVGRDLATRRRALADAERDDGIWRSEWARACARCWFGGGDEAPGLVEVRTTLEALARLAPRIDARDARAGEVRRLEGDVAAFAEAVVRVAGLMLSVDATGSPADASRRFEDVVRVAAAARDDFAIATGELGRARARRGTLVEAASRVARARAAMTSLFAVGTFAEVGERLASVKRRTELRTLVERAGRDVVEALGTSSLAEAEGLLRDLDREELKVRLSEAEVLLEARERAEADADLAHRRAADKIDEVGGDEEVARIVEARSTILLDVEDRAAGCLRLRLGILAAETAIGLYRDEHRSTLMSLASAAFSSLTDGAYAGLTSRAERHGETLIALTAEGPSKTGTELSKGTRFQLYLALRMAAYQEYVRARPSVPFVADDILETFDDARTRQALSAFARMAADGQVIYLTHHPHVCRIASAVCPGVRIHQLAPLPTA